MQMASGRRKGPPGMRQFLKIHMVLQSSSTDMVEFILISKHITYDLFDLTSIVFAVQPFGVFVLFIFILHLVFAVAFEHARLRGLNFISGQQQQQKLNDLLWCSFCLPCSLHTVGVIYCCFLGWICKFSATILNTEHDKTHMHIHLHFRISSLFPGLALFCFSSFFLC